MNAASGHGQSVSSRHASPLSVPERWREHGNHDVVLIQHSKGVGRVCSPQALLTNQGMLSKSSCAGTATSIKVLLCSSHCISTAFLNSAVLIYALQGLPVRAKSHSQVSCLSRTSLQGQQTPRECSKFGGGVLYSAKELTAWFSLHADGHLSLNRHAIAVYSI